MLLEEQDLNGSLKVGVFLLLEAVAFVVGEDSPDGTAGRTDFAGDLFGLEKWDTRIVAAVNHQQGRADFVGVIQRADSLKDGTHRGLTFVAVLSSA